jgi:hypothetical protein
MKQDQPWCLKFILSKKCKVFGLCATAHSRQWLKFLILFKVSHRRWQQQGLMPIHREDHVTNWLGSPHSLHRCLRLPLVACDRDPYIYPALIRWRASMTAPLYIQTILFISILYRWWTGPKWLWATVVVFYFYEPRKHSIIIILQIGKIYLVEVQDKTTCLRNIVCINIQRSHMVKLAGTLAHLFYQW